MLRPTTHVWLTAEGCSVWADDAVLGAVVYAACVRAQYGGAPPPRVGSPFEEYSIF